MGIIETVKARIVSATNQGKETAEHERREAVGKQQPTTQQIENEERERTYQMEQQRIVKERQMPTLQQKVGGAIADKVKSATIGAAQNIRQKNIEKMNPKPGTQKPLTREQVEAIARNVQRQNKGGGKMGAGQFHAPGPGSFPDPFAGIGGGGMGKFVSPKSPKKKKPPGRGGFMDPFNF